MNTTITTNSPEHFELLEGYACFRPAGKLSLPAGVQLVSQAIAYALDHQISRLLLDTTQLTGFPPPSITERYYIAREWASKAEGRVKIAFLATPESTDPEKFGVTVAFNIGLHADAFASEAEALAWLLDDQTG